MPTPRPSRKPPLHLTIEPQSTLREPGAAFKRIVAAATDGSRRWFLHATKGWRTERV